VALIGEKHVHRITIAVLIQYPRVQGYDEVVAIFFLLAQLVILSMLSELSGSGGHIRPLMRPMGQLIPLTFQ